MSRCIHSVPISDPCVKCALANTAPEIQTNGDQPAQTGTHAPSSLISEINASVDLREALRELGDSSEMVNGVYLRAETFRALLAAPAAERARIRAIVFRLLGNEWSANQLLEEIGE